MIKTIFTSLAVALVIVLLVVKIFSFFNRQDDQLHIANNTYKTCLSAKYPNPSVLVEHMGEECIN